LADQQQPLLVIVDSGIRIAPDTTRISAQEEREIARNPQCQELNRLLIECFARGARRARERGETSPCCGSTSDST
jgi:hypothetical protein